MEHQHKTKKKNWQLEFEEQLSLLGHRNWVLVVDKAFPLMNSEGITTIYTNDDFLNVLNYAMTEIDKATHVKPIIYTDKELKFLTPELVPGIEDFRKNLLKQLGKAEPMVKLHDSVFVKIDQAAKQFKVLVLKTNGTTPYSSVFICLDCRYWNNSKESQLREHLRTRKNV